MERLARLNMALVQQRKSCPDQPPSLLAESDPSAVKIQVPRDDETVERLQRLQATIVQQAKEIKKLRHQLQSMVPMLPLDGATRVSREQRRSIIGRSSDDDDWGSVSSDEEDDNEDPDVTTSRARGLEKLPLTSLHAQLKARDAEIHRLEQLVAQLTQAADASREKKRHAVEHYQQLTKSHQSQLRKYAAGIEAQLQAHRSLQKRAGELQEYVDVLEKKLVRQSRPTRS